MESAGSLLADSDVDSARKTENQTETFLQSDFQSGKATLLTSEKGFDILRSSEGVSLGHPAAHNAAPFW